MNAAYNLLFRVAEIPLWPRHSQSERTAEVAAYSAVLSPGIATLGLYLVIALVGRARSAAAPYAAAAFIVGAYWFAASMSFAIPAVTLARPRSDTFAGIRPADVPGFCSAKLPDQLSRCS